MPPTAPAAVGSDVVDPSDSKSVKLSPDGAVQAYAAAKDDPAGESARLFDTVVIDGQPDQDPARALWTALIKTMGEPVATLDGGGYEASSVAVGSATALATADSGALVFGQVKSVLSAWFAPAPGLSVSIGQQSYTALGANTLAMTKSVRVEHLQTVLLAVPPAGSEDPIKVIAVADLPTAVEVE
jgi:hypothetical protein